MQKAICVPKPWRNPRSNLHSLLCPAIISSSSEAEAAWALSPSSPRGQRGSLDPLIRYHTA